MALTPEQIKELKSQLFSQIQHLPPEKKTQMQKQIESMSPQVLESMLKQEQAKNVNPNSIPSKKSNKGVFRLIVDKDIPTKIIDENTSSIAVLDIKPISKGHIIIIPKKAVKETKNIPQGAFSLAKKLANRISSKLSPKNIEIQTEIKFEEAIINIIPIYDQPLNINYPRTDLKSEDLDSLYNLLKFAKKLPVIRIKKKANPENQILKMNRRIP